MCDPAVELCSDGDVLVRPDVGDLVQMNLTYFLNILLVPISIYMMVFLGNLSPWDEQTGTETFAFVLIWFVMIAYHVIIFTPPALTLLFYIVFGSDFFLF